MYCHYGSCAHGAGLRSEQIATLRLQTASRIQSRASNPHTAGTVLSFSDRKHGAKLRGSAAADGLPWTLHIRLPR